MRRLALAVVAYLAATAPATAVEVTLLAPTQFSRSNHKPESQTQSFETIEGEVALLLLTNGNGDGEMTVRSASIEVNGIEVDFDPRFETLLEEIVVTEGVNELTVALRGAPGGFVTISISQDVEICPPGVELCQIVTPDPTIQSAAPGSLDSFDLEYSTDLAETAGLGVATLYDSGELSFEGATNVFPDHLLDVQDIPDVLDRDGDPNTDRQVFVAWADPQEEWPGTNFQTLITLSFTTAPGFSTSTQINFFGTPAGDCELLVDCQFFSTPATILAAL